MIEIKVKEAALEQLKKVELEQNQGIRVEAIFVGSCALYVDHYIWIDDKKEDDTVYNLEGIPFLIANESEKHLPEKVILDFNPSLGYKLSSNEETFKYNLNLKYKKKSV